MRPEQLMLLDDTPLGLYGGRGQDVAIAEPVEPSPVPVPAVALCGPLEARPRPEEPARRAIIKCNPDGSTVGEGCAICAAIGKAKCPDHFRDVPPTPLMGYDETGSLVPWDRPDELPANPPPRCLGCPKSAKPPSHFCSAKCKAKWQSGINAWNRTLPKEPIEPETLF